jgi:DNA-binding PadR family transcriptional regulator
MGPGTLYGSLKRMLDAGLVQESDKRVDPERDDERRIYYQITGAGAEALAAELERYKRIVTLAQERKLYPKTIAYD